MAAQDRSASYSQSLERGLAILSAFRSGQPLLGVSELARGVGLSRSTAHRYIATLASLGYLQQDPSTRKYRLGPRVLDLGFSAINSMDLREVAAPHLQALSDETGHTVNMAVLDGPDIVYIERCRTARQGQREIDLNLHVGSRLPAYCTSLGKVLLANLADDKLRETLKQVQFTQRGPNTLTAREELLRELERVRASDLAGLRADGRRDQPRGAPLDGLLRRARRAPGAPAPPHRRRDLGAHRLGARAVGKGRSTATCQARFGLVPGTRRCLTPSVSDTQA